MDGPGWFFLLLGLVALGLGRLLGYPALEGLDWTLPAAALGAGFSYQGHLEDNGVPANGSYDFQFRLYG